MVVLLLHYSNIARNDPSLAGLLHMTSFILLLLSSERSFAVKLNKQFDGPLNLIPIPKFAGNYCDFMALSIHLFLTSNKNMPQSLCECLLTTLCNVSPFVKSFTSVTSDKLVNLFGKLTALDSMFLNQGQFRLVVFLTEIFNNCIYYQFDGNSHLIYSILRRKELFIDLSEFTYSTFVEKQLNNGADNVDEESVELFSYSSLTK